MFFPKLHTKQLPERASQITNIGNMTQTKTTPVTLYAEQEHAGIRAIVVLSIIVSYIFCFWLINTLGQLLPERIASLGFVLACLLSAPFAVGITWVLERWLKQVWHSGYKLTLQNDGFTVTQPETGQMVFNLDQNYLNLNWYFKLAGYKKGGRERRVPEKWLCLCCQVQQDEDRVIVYTFAPPKKTAVYQENESLSFEKLRPIDIYETHYKNRFSPPSRPNKLPPEVISGKNGRYWLAEQRRWQEGLELTFDDFETFLAFLQTHTE
jgi:hypothetical protein